MMIIVGIDPGIKGAIAFMNDSLISHIEDMPTHQIKSGKSNKNFVDPNGLKNILTSITGKIDCVWIEKVHAMPGQGVSSMFNFGMGYGIILGVCAALELPVNHVTPQKWKKNLMVPSGKDCARRRASEIMPYASNIWPLKKHDGRAESALIAYYGHKQEC